MENQGNKTIAPKFQLGFLAFKYWLHWISIGLMFLLSLLPFKALSYIGRLIGKFVLNSNNKSLTLRRKVVRRNLELAFPDMDPAEIERIYHANVINSGNILIYQIIAWFWSDRRFKKLVKLPEIDYSKYQNIPILTLSPHFLTMELNGRAFLLSFMNANGVYRKNSNDLLEWFQYRGRMKSDKKYKNRLIKDNDMRNIMRSLRNNQPMWYAPDHFQSSNSVDYVKFFGVEKTSTTRGTHMLVKSCPNLHMIKIYMEVKPDGFVFSVSEPELLDPNLSSAELSLQVNQQIEELVNRDPTQYLWIHRRFKNSQVDGNPYDNL